MFQGSSALTLDVKGRLIMPVRHRDALVREAAGQLTLTRHPEGCLYVFPRPVWEDTRDRLLALPNSKRKIQALMVGYAQDVDIDSAGRVLVAPELREKAGLTREVMLLGMGKHFELWDAATLSAREAAYEAEDLASMLDDFVF